MKVFKTFLTVLLFSAALPVAFGASIKSDYQKDFDFSRLHTFSFKTERDSGDRLATNTIEAQRIQSWPFILALRRKRRLTARVLGMARPGAGDTEFPIALAGDGDGVLISGPILTRRVV